jgi:hypothetical protein
MPSMTHLMLRSAQRARLEARTALLQLIFVRLDKFSDSLEKRESRAPGRNGCPLFKLGACGGLRLRGGDEYPQR